MIWFPFVLLLNTFFGLAQCKIVCVKRLDYTTDNENGCPVYDLDNCKSPENPPSCPILEITNSYPCTRFDCKATKLSISQRSIATFMTRQRSKSRSILEVPILRDTTTRRSKNLKKIRKSDFNTTVRALETFLGPDFKNISRKIELDVTTDAGRTVRNSEATTAAADISPESLIEALMAELKEGKFRKNDKNSPSTSKLLFENLVAKIKEEVYRENDLDKSNQAVSPKNFTEVLEKNMLSLKAAALKNENLRAQLMIIKELLQLKNPESDQESTTPKPYNRSKMLSSKIVFETTAKTTTTTSTTSTITTTSTTSTSTTQNSSTEPPNIHSKMNMIDYVRIIVPLIFTIVIGTICCKVKGFREGLKAILHGKSCCRFTTNENQEENGSICLNNQSRGQTGNEQSKESPDCLILRLKKNPFDEQNNQDCKMKDDVRVGVPSRIQKSEEVNNLNLSSLGPLQSPCKCPPHSSKNPCCNLQDSFDEDSNKEDRDYKPSGKVQIPQVRRRSTRVINRRIIMDI